MIFRLPVFFLFMVIHVGQTLAQSIDEKWKNLFVGVDYKQGVVLKHDKYMGHLSKGVTRGFEVDILKRTTGNTKWQRLTNYPDVGLSIVFFNYPTDILGESLAINYVGDYSVIRLKKFEAKFRLGIGLAYHTNPYDKETNNKNITYGSSITFSLQSKLNFQYNVHKNIYLNAGLAVNHFSMADIRRPNKGLNVISTDLGLRILLNEQDVIYPLTEEDRNFDRRWRYGGYFNVFVATYKASDGISYPVYSLSLFTQKPVGNLFDLVIGMDFFNNHVLKEVMKRDSKLDPTVPYPDHKKAGISVGVEYYMNKLSVSANMGYYIYKPYYFYGDYYQRYNLKYYFSDHVFINAGFKTHGADAENSELGIGYRF